MKRDSSADSGTKSGLGRPTTLAALLAEELFRGRFQIPPGFRAIDMSAEARPRSALEGAKVCRSRVEGSRRPERGDGEGGRMERRKERSSEPK